MTEAARPRVAVLLATRDGAAHLGALLASILAQEGADLRLIARDDGSTDATPALLAAWAAADARLEVHREPHAGLPHAFFRLLEIEGGRADAVFFADQDDVWLPGKIAAGLVGLARLDPARPRLVAHRLRAVGADLAPLGLSPLWPRPPSFGNALVENVATGCASVLDRRAADLVAGRLPASGALHHDWWCYLTVAAFGTVAFDPEPRLLYRLHGGNAVGLPLGLAASLRSKIARLRAGGSFAALLAQAEAFDAAHGARLGAAERRSLDAFRRIATSRAAALRLVAEPAIHRQRWIDDLAWRAGLILKAAGLAD